MHPKWKLYDDSRIEELYSWKELIERCTQTLQRPTVLFYQRVDKEPTLANKNSLRIEDYNLS
jgi:hypothetical protein